MKKKIILIALILLITLLPIANAASADSSWEKLKEWCEGVGKRLELCKEINKQAASPTGRAIVAKDIASTKAATGDIEADEAEMDELDDKVDDALQKITTKGLNKDYNKLINLLLTKTDFTTEQKIEALTILHLIQYEINKRDWAGLVGCGCSSAATAEGALTADVQYAQEGEEPSEKQTVETEKGTSWKELITKIFRRP